MPFLNSKYHFRSFYIELGHSKFKIYDMLTEFRQVIIVKDKEHSLKLISVVFDDFWTFLDQKVVFIFLFFKFIKKNAEFYFLYDAYFSF